MARFVAAVELFAEDRAAAAVDGADVFDHGVDARPELCAFGDGGDAARGRDLVVAGDVDNHKLRAEAVEHSCQGHGEEADVGVLLHGAAAKVR